MSTPWGYQAAGGAPPGGDGLWDDGRVSARDLDLLAVIAAGGALGSLARWAVGLAAPTTDGLPWGTFLVNVTGSLALGALMAALLEAGRPGRYLRPFLAVGVLGGYTTFSAFAVESWSLLDDGRSGAALGYLAASVLACLVAVWLGALGARAAVRRTR